MSMSSRALALGATLALGILCAPSADAAMTPKPGARSEPTPPGETGWGDEAAEFIRVATGHYDEKRERPRVPATPVVPATILPPEGGSPHDPLEILAIATGAYDRRPAGAGGEARKDVFVVPPRLRGVDLANPYKELVERYSSIHGLPPALADAVMKIESSYDPKAYNAGAIGLMQILLPTARGLGYAGDAEGLTHPETNLKYGIMYLAQAYRLSNGDTCQTVMRYQSGHYALRPNAANIAYCEKAKVILARAG